MTVSGASVDPSARALPACADGACLACGGVAARVLLAPRDVRAEQRWLERFHATRSRDPVGDAKDHACFTQSAARRVVACVECGTVRRAPLPPPEEVCETYASDAYGHGTLVRLARNQDAFFADKLARLAAALALPDGARVLEIGSFVGGFLEAAAARGWRATGIDVGEETSRFLRERGLDVHRGDVLDLDLPEHAYDAVFVWSTFDQLREPAAVLDRTGELLRPGGLLVVRVPNGRFETACLELRRAARGARRTRLVLCAQAYSNFVTFPYLTGFTPESLAVLLEAHGFACERIDGDTILPLADDRTLPFAVREEARFKRAVARACRHAERATGLLFDPWIDVVARRAAQ